MGFNMVEVNYYTKDGYFSYARFESLKEAKENLFIDMDDIINVQVWQNDKFESYTSDILN